MPRTTHRAPHLRHRASALAAGLVALTLAAVGAVGVDAARAATYPGPGYVTGDISPVHDASMVKAPDGTYILVTTGANLDIRTSRDRTSFTRVGVVWPSGAPWTYAYTSSTDPSTLWAPDISYRNGTYYLYYAASQFGSNTSAIFLATSPTAMPGTWTNRGKVIETSSASTYNAIDPNLVVDASGAWWLSLGSFWSGIKLIRLNASTGLRSTSDTKVRALATRTVNSGSIEAPMIVRHGSYYYLFVSFDFCCRGAASTYRTMVGRSTSITGTYRDRAGVAMTSGGGTEILASHDGIYGPGHPGVLTDTDSDLLTYHYYTSTGTPMLGINLLRWDSSGWPYVA